MAADDMLGVTAPTYTDPSNYELTHMPRPTISEPTDVQVKVHAASINPIDVKKAGGAFKVMMKDEFPYKLGYDCAGVVTQTGSDVSKFKVGDEVYVRIPESHRGSWSEYAMCPEYFIAAKPKSLSFENAASIPLAAMTALQAFRKYKGSLKGKTVFVPGGLSGTGAYACQLAKNFFHAGKVISTVSTAKVSLVPHFLGEGVVDQIIDYTKMDPMTIIPRGTVDFILDTTGESMKFLSLMIPSTSTIVSISTLPSGTQLLESSVMRRKDNPKMPLWTYYALNMLDAISRVRARRWGVDYQYMFLDSKGEDLEKLAGYVEQGLLKSVVGSTADLKDLEAVKKLAGLVYSGKGGIGKAVIKVAPQADLPKGSGSDYKQACGEGFPGALFHRNPIKMHYDLGALINDSSFNAESAHAAVTCRSMAGGAV